jgi:DNA-directed RNA polymerase subunit RPC12/RpoP
MEVDRKMTTDAAPPRWIVVTRPDRPGLLDELAWRYRLAAWVEVLADRRRQDRRRRDEACAVDLRMGERRGVPGDRTHTPTYRLVRQGDGFEIFEATGFAPAQCPECGSRVMFEMPRVSEPPARFDVQVVHDAMPPPLQHRPRHIVELLLHGSGDRPLLASRTLARTRVEFA